MTIHLVDKLGKYSGVLTGNPNPLPDGTYPAPSPPPSNFHIFSNNSWKLDRSLAVQSHTNILKTKCETLCLNAMNANKQRNAIRIIASGASLPEPLALAFNEIDRLRQLSNSLEQRLQSLSDDDLVAFNPLSNEIWNLPTDADAPAPS